MNTQRPPQRPPQSRPPMTREEYERRRAASIARQRALARKRRQRIALLALAAAAVILTIVLTAVGIHRAVTATPADATTTASPTTTAAPASTTAPAETTAAPAAPTTQRKFTICIDPGHGFDDPGASTKYLGDTTESEVTLAIGLALRDELLARGFSVIMTHDTNTPPATATPGEQYLFGLAKRTAYANDAAPDFYLSIHGDTYEDPAVQGARVYYREQTGADNTAIAAIAQTFVDALDRGLPDAAREPLLKAMQDDSAYYVLRNVTMQAVLVEVGFASNANDAKNMLDPAWQKQVAAALADGVEMNFADEE